METLNSIINSPEFWLAVAGIATALIALWGWVVKRKGIPPLIEEPISDGLEFTKEFAEEKAEYLKKVKAEKEAKIIDAEAKSETN